MQRRSMERARHGVFLVVKAGADDLGSRPLTTPFASPAIEVGADGRPRATVWNLGNREVAGVKTEFYCIPAGLPVRPENAQLIGPGNMAIIPPGQSVQVACTQVWRRMSHADQLVVMASHPELDPVKHPFDAVRDRRVGQLNYPWVGCFEGRVGPQELKVRIDIRASNQMLVKVRYFEEESGRLPSFPRCDQLLRPNRHTIRWMAVEAGTKEIYDLVMLDNDQIAFAVVRRPVALPEATLSQVTGRLERV